MSLLAGMVLTLVTGLPANLVCFLVLNEALSVAPGSLQCKSHRQYHQLRLITLAWVPFCLYISLWEDVLVLQAKNLQYFWYICMLLQPVYFTLGGCAGPEREIFCYFSLGGCCWFWHSCWFTYYRYVKAPGLQMRPVPPQQCTIPCQYIIAPASVARVPVTKPKSQLNHYLPGSRLLPQLSVASLCSCLAWPCHVP